MLWLVLLFLRYRAAAENVRFGPTLGIYREWSFLNHHITVHSFCNFIEFSDSRCDSFFEMKARKQILGTKNTHEMPFN